MIIRNFGVRHGRRVLAAPAPRSFLRALSIRTPTTTVADPEAAPVSATQAAADARKRAVLLKAEIDRLPEEFRKYEAYQEQTKSLGSKLKFRYLPDEVLKRPPHDVTLEDLMAAQAHMGHHTSQWNPANSRYIYGEREGIHIISLETTAAHLRRAANVVESVAYHAGLILFVGNRKGHRPIVVRMAELAGACHLYQKWTPGAITNKDVILASGELRVVDELDRTLDGFDAFLRDSRPVSPDLVICLNPVENYPLLHECGLASIPTIGIIDTDADPTWVTYQIPANDDSLRSVALIAGVLGRAGERGRQRRLADAAEGKVAWTKPHAVQAFIQNHNSTCRSEALAKLEELAREGKLKVGEAEEIKQSFTEESEEEIKAQLGKRSE
ncbi:putative mitochondrial SSU ribosomal protein S2 precursor [Podospora fimiseda]|uniref:Mitochondrial SSU ribosomal protein S2 n=1 Tax=Podospora fimiseda TaxID=252190 RepID=A0AAN7H119_9PEZI|nr:putative mitochondrial SSU ribosomal protein S2 precursor [Podospora fimiseda]